MRSGINHFLHLSCLAIPGKQPICMVTRWLFVRYSWLPVVKHLFSRVTNNKKLSVTRTNGYKTGHTNEEKSLIQINAHHHQLRKEAARARQKFKLFTGGSVVSERTHCRGGWVRSEIGCHLLPV